MSWHDFVEGESEPRYWKEHGFDHDKIPRWMPFVDKLTLLVAEERDAVKFCRRLNKAQLSHLMTLLSCLDLVEASIEFERYVRGVKFVAYIEEE